MDDPTFLLNICMQASIFFLSLCHPRFPPSVRSAFFVPPPTCTLSMCNINNVVVYGEIFSFSFVINSVTSIE